MSGFILVQVKAFLFNSDCRHVKVYVLVCAYVCACVCVDVKSVNGISEGLSGSQ